MSPLCQLVIEYGILNNFILKLATLEKCESLHCFTLHHIRYFEDVCGYEQTFLAWTLIDMKYYFVLLTATQLHYYC